MSILDRFKKKDQEVRLPEEITDTGPQLPENLERFRVPESNNIPRTEFYDKPLEVPRADQIEKIDMVLEKLETIDTRLKLIEEKIKRY
jgi:hypothetical protein